MDAKNVVGCGAILALEGFIPPALRSRILGEAEERKGDFEPAQVYRPGTVAKDPEFVPSDMREIRDPVEKRFFHQLFGEGLGEYLSCMNKLGMQPPGVNPSDYVRDEGYMMLRYRAGARLDWHNDDWGLQFRRISAILYPNDDYRGGLIHFPIQGWAYKPKAGTMLIFPSNYVYPHRADAVLEGVKYAVTTWFR